MQELHLPGDESALSSPASGHAVTLPSEPSSPPPPPPISLNPPSRLAPGVAPAQVTSSRGPAIVPRSVFSSVRLPRSSSLLPPSHGSPTPRSPSPVAAAATAYTQHFQTHRDGVHPPVSMRRPSTPSSQTDKGGPTRASPREGSRAHNRWSSSTVSSTSSRASLFAPHQSHARRASIESIVLNGSPPPSHRNRMPSISINLSASPAAVPTTIPDAIATRSRSPSVQSSSSRMPYDQSRDRYVPRGHSRDRNGKGSKDSGKGRVQKPLSQKTMLSRALQKANTAVQLDNAQNFQGAREAYSEACELLRQVLQRTTTDEDKRKLEAIRNTYTSRIEELDQMGPWEDEDEDVKALPACPGSDDHDQDRYTLYQFGDDEEVLRIEPTRRVDIMGDNDDTYSRVPVQQQQGNGYTKDGALERRRPSQPQEQRLLQSSFSRAPARLRSSDELRKQASDPTYALPPLKRIRPPSPLRTYGNEITNSTRPGLTSSLPSRTESQEAATHPRDGSQNSWLDPIDESGDSTSSSVHSRTSSLGYRRRHIRAVSGNTEAEFDTALDAAIEAAYNEGYEPMGSEEYNLLDAGEEVMSALRKAEMGGKFEEAQPPNLEQRREKQSTPTGFYEDDSSEEEERLLEEITRDFAIEDFTMEQMQNPLVAPELDANTEAESNFIPAVRSFSALSDRPPVPTISKTAQPAAPPPTQALPELPPKGSPSPVQSVQSRRLSGQNWKQLKIETTNLGPPPRPSHGESLSQTKSEITADKDQEPPAEVPVQSASTQQGKSLPTTDSSPSEPQGIGSPSSKGKPADKEDDSTVGPSSPSANKLRKNFSSSSLRSMKSRNMSLSNLDEGSDMSPGTPSSNHFGRVPALPTMPTPMAAAFKDTMEGPLGGGLHLFDDNFHMPATPGSPNPMYMDGPVPLEPCPTEPMLRPFWLMRCLFQTLVHPRGGYLSTKLFVPRDVWRVKGVKIKNVEDKIANCDYLTAALMKLAKVDTFDADAMLEEMQSLEGVLEQTQAALSRKLGNEVGVQGSGALFKDASLAMDGDGASSVPRSSSVSGKSSFSWRRLRPKTSGVGLASTRIGGADAKDLVVLPTLPMTTHPTTRPAKRNISQTQFIGPNANYMDSLARLFDAAQAIDQIARQVEDPGLKHADKTQVGLELCTRHAAEFFGLYICRFVLTDLGLLLDKFIKRGSEWVLA